MKNEKLKGETTPSAYYGRHHLPQLNTDPPTLSGKINRNFYRSLRLNGRSHSYIMRMIQPERTTQFLKDIQFIAEYMDRAHKIKTSQLTWWSKIKRKFISLLFISLFVSPVISQVPQTDGVSVVSEKKDTLFLANNALGYEIMDAWVNYPEKPIIILKPEKWIINENTKRRDKKTK
jgi:hypothetical protein